MEERRKSQRLDLNLPAQWETESGIQQGTVINCSLGGCFIKAQVEEPGDEPMKLAIHLPNGSDIELEGSVAYYLPTMGFGLRFTSRSDESHLNRWLDYLKSLPNSVLQGVNALAS